jgi:hypothetical protein
MQQQSKLKNESENKTLLKRTYQQTTLNNPQHFIHILKTTLKNKETTQIGYKMKYKLEEVERDYIEFRK